ncbi:MAG: hypothetical protein ACI89J_004280 [Hyphomicrobiaceae bacterium]|jgi:hypothetical protein
MLPNDQIEQTHQVAGSSHWSNIFAGVFFACLGAYVLWEAQNFEDVGATMPNLVGIGLIVLSGLLILANHFQPELIANVEPARGSMLQRAVLITLISIWVIVLPHAGFLLSSIIAFALIAAAVPKSDRWNRSTIVGHAIGGVCITVGFWYVLTTFLNVPLPATRLW